MSESVGECGVCGTKAALKCSACHSVFYCGKKHQREHWTDHRAVCRSYEVKTTPELGPHLVASRDLKRFEVILSELPLVLGPDHRSASVQICAGCCRHLETDAVRCPRCKWPICRSSCPGLNDPARHATECGLFTSTNLIYEKVPCEILLPLRSLILQTRDPEKWDMFLNMGERAQQKQISDFRDDAVFYVSVDTLQLLGRKNRDVIPVSNKTLIKKLYAVLDVHSLDIGTGNMNFIRDQDDEKLKGLYSAASLLQANCMPNTNVTFQPQPDDPRASWRAKVTVRAAKDISKGEVLTVLQGTSPLLGTRARFEETREKRNFRCSCSRCLDPTEHGTFVGALKCGTCSGWLLPVDTSKIEQTNYDCNGTCDGFLPPDYWDDYNSSMSCESTFCGVYMMHSSKARDEQVVKFEEVLARFGNMLHPYHHFLSKIRNFWMMSYCLAVRPGDRLTALTDKEVDKLAELSRDLVNVTEQMGPYHNRSVHFIVNPLIQWARADAEKAKRMLESKGWDKKRASANISASCEKLERAMEITKLDPQNRALMGMRSSAETELLAILTWGISKVMRDEAVISSKNKKKASKKNSNAI